MQFSNLFFKSSMTQANNWRSIGRISWRMASFQIIQRTGFVSVNTRFQIPPKEKITHWKIGRTRGHGTSLKREMRCLGNMFRTTVIDWFAVCAVAPSCWKWLTQRKGMPTISPPPPRACLLSTTHSKDVRFPWVTLYYVFCQSSSRMNRGWHHFTMNLLSVVNWTAAMNKFLNL